MRSVTDMTNMLSNSNISIENYDAILNGWSSKTNKQGVRLGANGLNYCNAQYARQSIIDTYGWTIIDAGEYCSTLSTEVLEKTSFTISPNPTSDFLSITGNQKRVSISIYNLLGKEVLPESNSNKVNVKALPNGIYVIRIREGLQEVRKKFVKN
ncbi:MAG: T9SS type A sorting domain-containing protein [Polaribacter sp.]|nr:T9SS type A sorting domain-containing protein [Polaribacter sp.]